MRKRRIKIAIIGSTFSRSRPGGAATYFEGRAEFLAQRCDIRLYCLGDSRDNRQIYRSIAPYKFGRWGIIWGWLVLGLKLLMWRPDYIESHNIPVSLPVFFGGGARYFFHGPAADEATIEGAGWLRVGVARMLELLVMTFATRVCTVSRAFACLVIDRYGRSLNSRGTKVVVRYPRILAPPIAVPIEDIRLIEPLQLVCVRRLVERTGVEQLIGAYLSARTSGGIPATAILHIVGQGAKLGVIRKLVQSENATEAVIIHGNLSNEARNRLYATSHFNIVPTLALEGFGLVVLEAAFQGCPSLVTAVGGLPEVIGMLHDIGLICQSSTQDLERAIEKLPCLIDIDRMRLRSIAMKRFSFSRLSRQPINL
jgi:glycosyltransferase involved in cell wall biosynthesis